MTHPEVLPNEWDPIDEPRGLQHRHSETLQLLSSWRHEQSKRVMPFLMGNRHSIGRDSFVRHLPIDVAEQIAFAAATKPLVGFFY
jgi:hypothetical protein